MEKKGPGFLGKLWSNTTPAYMAARTFLMIAVGTPLFYGAMAAMPGRPLNCAEENKLRKTFKSAVDYDRIRINSSIIARIYTGVLSNGAVSFGNTIFVGADLKDGLEKASGDVAYGFVHETAHVMKYQHDPLISLRGPRETIANFFTNGDRAKQYEYRLEPGKKFGEYTIEQQASIVADWFNIQRGDIPFYLRDYDLTEPERSVRYRAVLDGLFNGGPDAAPTGKCVPHPFS